MLNMDIFSDHERSDIEKTKDKTFADYEEKLIEKIRDKTIGELLDTYCRLDAPYLKHYNTYDDFSLGNSYTINLSRIQYEIEKALYGLIPKDKDFFDLPILGVTEIPEYDWPAYAIKKNRDSSYILFGYDYDRIKAFMLRASDCVLEPSPFATIRDLEDYIGEYVI